MIPPCWVNFLCKSPPTFVHNLQSLCNWYDSCRCAIEFCILALNPHVTGLWNIIRRCRMWLVSITYWYCKNNTHGGFWHPRFGTYRKIWPLSVLVETVSTCKVHWLFRFVWYPYRISEIVEPVFSERSYPLSGLNSSIKHFLPSLHGANVDTVIAVHLSTIFDVVRCGYCTP